VGNAQRFPRRLHRCLFHRYTRQRTQPVFDPPAQSAEDDLEKKIEALQLEEKL
jgi:hypothetical protein